MPIPEILRGRLRLPVIGAPMFIVSTPRLVLAQCKAGIVGSFPALNARPASQLDDWLAEITEELAAFQRTDPQRKVAPFAVNQIVHSSNNRLEEDVGLCVKHKVPIVITSLRPPAEVVAAVHGHVAGGSVSLMAAADLVVIGKSARITSAFARIGFSPDSGSTTTLTARMGVTRARRFFLMSETLDADAALSAGLVDFVVDDNALLRGGAAERARAMLSLWGIFTARQ